MVPQMKMLRVFELISLLKRPPFYTKEILAKRLCCSVKTIERYFILLEEIGFFIDSKNQQYFLSEPSEDKKIYFTAEEVQVLQGMMHGLGGNHSLKESISQKLYLNSELLPISNVIVDNRVSQIIEAVNAGLNTKCQVVLLNYYSPNSNSVSDRVVEPLMFTDGYEQFHAFEPVSGRIKTFHVQRIKSVENTRIPFTFKGALPLLDIFGYFGEQKHEVKLLLNHKAYRLLVEDYPHTKPFTKEVEHGFILETALYSFHTIGRFILGLIDCVTIMENDELKEYVKRKVDLYG